MKTRAITKFWFFVGSTFLSLSSFGQLSGTYSVGGTSPSFPTLDSAFNYMEIKGVSGKVRLNVREGLYTLRTTISTISGASASNTIQVAPDPKNSKPVIFKNRITGTTDNFLMNIKQGYLRFDSLEFRLDSTSKLGKIIDITATSPNLTLNACKFYGKDSTSTANTFATIYDATTIAVNNFKVTNCIFYNGGFSIYHAAQSTARETGFEFRNNKIYNYYNQAVYMSFQTQPLVQGNYMIDINKYTAADGIYFTSCDSVTAKENQVYMNGGSGAGIYLGTCNGSATSPNMVVNNFVGIYDKTKTAATSGIYVTAGKYTYIYYNTVYHLSQSATGKCIYLLQSVAGQNCTVKNNNLINGGAGYAIYLSSNVGIGAIDYNNYYSASPTNLAYLTSAYGSLSAWKAATIYDPKSISVNAKFTGTFDLHTFTPALNGLGTPLTGITADIDGQTRSSANPDMGADEFTPLANDISVVKIYFSAVSGCGTDSLEARAVIKNIATRSQINYDINLNITDGSSFYAFNLTSKDSIKPQQYDTIYFKKINTVNGGIYSFKAFTSLSTDQDRSNDTMTAAKKVKPSIGKPDAKNDTICIGGSNILTTNFPSKTFLRWYDSKTGGALIIEDNKLVLNGLKKDTAFYVSAYQPPGNGSLNTIGTVNNGCTAGVMFDITPKVDIEIDSFTSFSNAGTNVKMVIYIKKGTSIGSETAPGAWMAVDSTTYTCLNTSTPFTVKLTKPLVLDQDSTYGIFFNSYARYTSQASTDYSNDDLTLTTTSGVCTKWTSYNAGRAFSGKVFYRLGQECESDRVPYKVKVNPLPYVFLGKDTAYCANSGINYKLNAGAGFASYLWSTSDTTETITVNKDGVYAVDVIDKNGCANGDRITIAKNANPLVSIGNDTAYCASNGINYKLDAGPGFKTYKWNNAATNQSITVSSPGIYNVTVTNNADCEAMDTLKVIENKNPVVKFGKDTTYCVNEGVNLMLDAGAGYTDYKWSTSANSQTINVTSSGVYSVIVTDAYTCRGGDTIFVVEMTNPVLNLGPDITYCINPGINKKLDAGPGFTYKWSTGATTQTINVTGAGTYSAEIRDNNNCPDKDTMMVTANPNPKASLGPDREVDPKLPINETLDAGIGFKSYKWSNGHIFQSIIVDAVGTYWVEVTDENGCKGYDTIVVFAKPVSVNSLKNMQVQVFPNPSNNALNIVSEKGFIENIVVYSLTGQVVYTQKPNATKSVIDTGNWANGVYTLDITINEKSAKVKMVVQH